MASSTNPLGTKGLILMFREIGAPKSALLDIPYIKQASGKIKL
jgi:hypothetical protein